MVIFGICAILQVVLNCIYVTHWLFGDQKSAKHSNTAFLMAIIGYTIASSLVCWSSRERREL